MHATCAGAKFISAERSEAEPASAARRARRRRNPRYGAALVNLRLPTSAVWPIGQTGRPLGGCRLAVRQQRGACGFLCRLPKKSRSTVSFGNISKGNRGDVLFCGMPCEPGTPLEAPPCATRPPPARPARNGGFLFCDTLPACRRPEPVHRDALRLLRARSKGSRRHAAPRVGISDCDIVSV